jgi:hypothetical protein
MGRFYLCLVSGEVMKDVVESKDKSNRDDGDIQPVIH